MSHDVEVLNHLIARLRGTAEAYRRAGADGPGLADAFAGAAQAHDTTSQVLAGEARALGASPSDRTDAGRSTAALAKAATQGQAATAEAVERIEAELLGDFQAAMDDPRVSGPVRDAILRAFDGVKAGHDRALQRLDTLGG